MRSRTWQIASLLFGSGFCALVYQVAWLRDFRLIFGASTAASAAVVAIFIGGLGGGGLLLGPRADRHPRPLAFYSFLESIVALSAAATPLLLALARSIYLATGGSARLGGATATFIRLVLSAIVLGVPTIAMGGTLPAAARAATRAIDARRQDVAALYALNTLGAVAGCLVATFWLLELFGTRSTLWLASAVNLLVAVAARQLDRQWSTQAGRPPSEAGTLDEPGRVTRGVAPDGAAPVRFLLVASGTVGFAFFLMELVWYRILTPLLGGSVFTFGLVLAMALVGIGAGGLLYALASADRPVSLAGFGTTCLIEAAAIAITFALGDRVAVLALSLLPLHVAGFTAQIAGWTIVAAIVILPPALIAGYQFPLLIALVGQARAHVGADIGRVYAANTIGAIAGSLAGGFGLLPWLSATGSWRLVAIVLILLGAAAVLLPWFCAGFRSLPAARLTLGAQLFLAIAAVLLTTATGPTSVWRQSGIGAGRTSFDVFTSSNQFHAWTNSRRRFLVWQGDGVESSVALINDAAGYSFFVNGKSDGSARGDAGNQIMLGLLGVLGNPSAGRTLVIGLGTGSTAGWLAAVPAVQRVDVVELEPLVIDVAHACLPVNRDVMHNPKVHITIGDARETLLTTRDRYDAIASEPSNPFRAGIASLFTQEYYRAAADRLSEDGVFAQWVQGYEIDPRTLRTIYATMASVFPQIDTWQTDYSDLVLVASKRRHALHAADLSKRIAEEPFKSALAHAWRAVDVDGLLAHYVANDSLARAIAGDPAVDLNTDDRNVVEFGLARAVGRSVLLVTDLRRVARASGAWRPPMDDETGIAWTKLDTAYTSFNAMHGSFSAADAQSPATEQARVAAVQRYYRDHDTAGTRALWREQSEMPRDPIELVTVADSEADAGSDDALAYIARLRQYEPGEADTILATLRLRQDRLDEAAAAVEAALTKFRTDPWPTLQLKQRAIQVAQALADHDARSASRMLDALREPFCLRALEDNRRIAVAEITRRVDLPRLCGPAVSALEPHVPWTESFLRLRRDCYQATSDQRLQVATRDLREFLVNAGQSLVP